MKPKQTKDISNLADDFKNELLKKISALEAENQDLKNQISKPIIKTTSPEEQICIEQISRLKTLSEQRSLELDEVKRLDLLVKNLLAIRGHNAEPEDKSKKTKNIDVEKLLSIAKSSIDHN